MNELQELQQVGTKKVPQLKTGQTVRVHQRVKEGEKSRIQVFEGLIIKINSGNGVDKTFTVRKVVNGIGVEKILPLYSPLIEKIEVKKEGKVRRAKIYYMRDRSGKSARLKESFVSEKELEESVEELAEQKAKEEGEKAKEEGESSAEEVSGDPAEEVAEAPAEEKSSEDTKAEEPPAEESKTEQKEESPAEEVTEEPKEEKKEDPKEEAPAEKNAEEALAEETKEEAK